MVELHVNVHHENGTYWAEVQELPGCFASGETKAELMEAVDEAVQMYLEPAASNTPTNGNGRSDDLELSSFIVATDRPVPIP